MFKVKTKKIKSILFKKKIVAGLLNDIAEITAGQIKTDVKKGMGVKTKLKPLKASTIKRKRKKGSRFPRKPLIDTGKMTNVVQTKEASRTNLMSEIDVARNMREIADYHNEGAGHLPKRLWFGIGKKTKDRVKKMFKARARDIIKTSLGKLK